MAVVRRGPTKCAHEPGCPHDIGPAAAGFAPGINAGAVPELRTGASGRGSGPVERFIDPIRRDGRGDEPHVLHHRGHRPQETTMANEAPAVWPKGTSESDKNRRSQLLHAAMDRNAHTLDPVGRACEDLGIRRNAASMILRSERLRSEITEEPAEEPAPDANDVDFGEGAPNAYDQEVERRAIEDESYLADEPNVVPVPGLVLTGGQLGLVIGDPGPTAAQRADPDLTAYRIVREFVDRMGPMTPSIDLRDELARRIADRAADAA